MQSIQKSVLSVSLRSVIQATDSTCNGCHANAAAEKKLGQRCFVITSSAAKSSAALAACWATFIQCSAPACIPPNRSTSSINDIHTSGHQCPIVDVVNDQR